jgi:peptidoglycan/LPS O-acetylase OafA/YrhL
VDVGAAAPGVGLELPPVRSIEVDGYGPASGRSPQLDGLRALAVAGVVAYHAIFMLPVTWHRLYPVGLHLDAGVVVFFVLSGYLIYRPFVAAHLSGAAAPPLRRYALRRVARIYPAYLVALLGLYLAGWIYFDDFAQVVQHVTLTQGYFRRSGTLLLAPPGIAQSWTLVVEVSFYALVPLWAWVMRRAVARVRRDAFRVEVAGALALIAVGVVANAWASYRRLPALLAVVPPHLAGLGWGMLLAVLVTDGRTSLWLRPRRTAPPQPDSPHLAVGDRTSLLSRLRPESQRLASRRRRMVPVTELCWLGAIAALALLSYLIDDFAGTATDAMIDHDLSWLIAVLLVTPVVLGAPSAGLVPRLLEWRPVVAVGTVSYGIYLWHETLLLDLPGPWRSTPVLPAVAGMAAKVAVAVVAGTASYLLIERPSLHLTRQGNQTRRRAEP